MAVVRIAFRSAKKFWFDTSECFLVANQTAFYRIFGEEDNFQNDVEILKNSNSSNWPVSGSFDLLLELPEFSVKKAAGFPALFRQLYFHILSSAEGGR